MHGDEFPVQPQTHTGVPREAVMTKLTKAGPWSEVWDFIDICNNCKDLFIDICGFPDDLRQLLPQWPSATHREVLRKWQRDAYMPL